MGSPLHPKTLNGRQRAESRGSSERLAKLLFNIEALTIRIGCWGPLYYINNKEPSKIVKVIIKGR